MKRWVLRAVALAAFILSSFTMAQGGTVRGTVKNGTTGQPAAGIDLALVQPMGGMQEVAHAKSGARGEFTFDNPNLGAQPMLVRATYHGIHFNQMVPPGISTVQVDIFEPSKDAKTINVPMHVVVFQPNGTTLVVGEEYQIENKSQPPHAYYRNEGNFDFTLPEKGQLQQVSAVGPAGMPVVQLPIDQKNNHYSIAYAFRPGESSVRLSYELPYADNTAIVKIPTIYPGGRLLVVAPPSVQISGEGLVAGGQEQGMNLYGREDVPAGTLVAINVSGTAPSSGAGQQGRDAQQGVGESSGVNIQAVPGRLDTLKWPLLGVFALVFTFFAFLLARKNVVVVSRLDTGAEELPAPKKPKKSSSQATSASASTPVPSPVTAATPSNGASSLAEVDAAIGTSLDALKERLFRLELRRQAGTISEEEYSLERTQAEKILRDLVRG
jgi:hypothetical protein